MSGPLPPSEPGLRSQPVPSCAVCGSAGVTLHQDLTDRTYGAPGTWRTVRCPEPTCGLVWLDPAPEEEELPRAYHGYHTHDAPPRRPAWTAVARRWVREGYFASRFGYRMRGSWAKRLLALGLLPHPGLRAGLDAAIMYLAPRPGGRVVDVGCGGGWMLAQLRDLGWQVEGVDFDPQAAAVAAARGLTVHVGSLGQQRYPEAAFDAVTMSHVLEHVPNPAGLLVECRRVLKPEGRIVVVTPNAGSLGHARFGPDWRGLEPPRHLQVFTGPALGRLARSAGLRVLVLRSSATGAAFFHAESRRILGEASASPQDVRARRFAREERRRLGSDPWAGEELLLVGTRP